MWSASSMTVISTASSFTKPCFMRSSSRPGHATTMSTPSFRAATWRFWLTPPKIVVVLRPYAAASGSRVALICVASSRVGARTRPRMRPARRDPPARAPPRRAAMGIEKASVLPEPVLPRPSTSRPASVSGRVSTWIGNAVVLPSFARTSSRGVGTPSAPKVMSDMRGFLGRSARIGGLCADAHRVAVQGMSADHPDGAGRRGKRSTTRAHRNRCGKSPQSTVPRGPGVPGRRSESRLDRRCGGAGGGGRAILPASATGRGRGRGVEAGGGRFVSLVPRSLNDRGVRSAGRGGAGQEAMRSVAARSARAIPGSVAECEASGTTTNSASGHARCRSHAVMIGVHTS